MMLENERLRVCFAEPEALAEQQRFDRTAMVAEVTLDGVHKFCTPEQLLPHRRTTNGRGLCGEFVLPGAAEEAQAGEWFLKPGVGLLKQSADGAALDMWKRYEMRPFPVSVEECDGNIRFRQEATPCNGWAVDIEKRFHLEENRLILDISARNSGEKPIELQEYQHNFVSLSGAAVGPGYVLELECDRLLSQLEGQTLRQGDEQVISSAVRVAGTQVAWIADMNEKILYHRSEQIDPGAARRWKLKHLPSGVSVSEETEFTPSRIDIWSVEHCACPEFYHTAHIAPGESAAWRRIWKFEG